MKNRLKAAQNSLLETIRDGAGVYVIKEKFKDIFNTFGLRSEFEEIRMKYLCEGIVIYTWFEPLGEDEKRILIA